MFFTNRRHRLIYLCLTGMEIAWITPFLLLIYRPLRAWSPGLIFLMLFLGLLGWMLIIEVLSRIVLKSPHFELAVLSVIGLTSLLLIRLFIYPERGVFNLTWFFDSLRSMIRFEMGFPPALIVVLLNFFIWLRATSASSRDLDFWNVGLNFRVGMLLLIIGGSMLHQISGLNVLSFLWVFFTCGLTAVALTRIDGKAADTRSTGPILPTNRLLQILAMVALTITLTIGLSNLYSPDNLQQLFRWILPVWTIIGNGFLILLTFIFWLLEPILIWLAGLIMALVNNIDFSILDDAMTALREGLATTSTEATDSDSLLGRLPTWIWTLLRYLGLAVGILLSLGFILLFLDRIRVRQQQDQAEVAHADEVTFGQQAFESGMNWLKDNLQLIRRYGISRHLLAAISVENMYANLCRLAQKQGYPRRPSQPPDDYLPILNQVFIDRQAPLSRLTQSYMRVHYGGQVLSPVELRQIREDYGLIQSAERRNKNN